MGKKGFQPFWSEEEPQKGTYRSIFKWGDPKGFKHPNSKMYQYIKDNFKLTDDDFKKMADQGLNQVKLENKPIGLDLAHKKAMEAIVGTENVSATDYDRLKYSTGNTMEEALELRQNKIAEVTDLVVHPRNKNDCTKIIAYCNENTIPVYVYGGGSSVNFGYRPTKGGITLVLNTHMNKVLKVNEKNKTITVQAGIMGPDLEYALNNAKSLYKTKRNYTNGHFPQSFEYSSAGGWFVTLGAGQESTYYGDAATMVLGIEVVTPVGDFKTFDFPSTATGPKLVDMFKGSEGCFGVVTELTLKMFQYYPENKFGFSYVFKNWEDGVNACREITQSEFGKPGVLRISDPEETSMGLRLYGVTGTPLESVMDLLGYKEGQRCLMLGRTCGEKQFAKNVRKNSKRICRKYGGMSLTAYPVVKWEHGRYNDPYMREDLNDYGLILDTLETGVTYENLDKVHSEVRAYVKSRNLTGCLCHASHFYPEGTNLYFIFFCKLSDLAEYRVFQTGIFDAIQKAGGSLSHHHGVGRMIGPWMQEHLGSVQMEAIRAIKHHFDPKNIMNPGGQLGLDIYPGDLKDHNWRIDWKKKK